MDLTLKVWRQDGPGATGQMETHDVRARTSRTLAGSDAAHADPDYSAACVVLRTDEGVSGFGFGMARYAPIAEVIERNLKPLLIGKDPLMTEQHWDRMYNLNLLIAGSVLIGMFASVTHVALPIAPDLVSHEKRGRAIGTVMTGLLLGILLARTFSGWVSGIHGWRWVFVVAAIMNAAAALLAWFVLRPMRRAHKGRVAAEAAMTGEAVPGRAPA